MNYWVMAFPCLIYIASVGKSQVSFEINMTPQANFSGTVVGIMRVHIISTQMGNPATVVALSTAYYSIPFSLNLLLTLMIVTRLLLHRRNIRCAVGTFGGAAGLYTTIVVMLVESYALYAIALLSYIVPRGLNSIVTVIPAQIIPSTQVRVAPPFSSAQQVWSVVF